MAELHNDLPPPYTDPVEDAAAAFATQTAVGGLVLTRHSGSRCYTNSNHAVRSMGRQNGTSRRVVGIQNISNSFSGFLDVMYDNKKLPWGTVKNMLYKLVLFVYYLANSAYSIFALVVDGEHFAYHFVHIFICLIGCLYELVVVILDVRVAFAQSCGFGEEMTRARPNQVTHANQPRQAWTADMQVQDYYHKAKNVLQDYVISSLGEFLIYPTLICTMYGFINERAWRFDDEITKCTVVFSVYSVIMDTFYTKLYAVYTVARVVCASYVKYDKLVRPTKVEWKRFITPVYLTIPFAILTALTHWLMIGIIGVRIYVDNFTPDRDGTEASIPDKGDYKITPLTGCMIACTIYLPIVSWVAYIILNKLWFFEIFSAINQLSTRAERMLPPDLWDDKLFAFVREYWSYTATMFLVVPFTFFSVAVYLPDYGSTDYEVASSARNSIEGLGTCFIILFLLSNIQASILYFILLIFIVTIIVLGLPILCGIICYYCSGQNVYDFSTYRRSF